MAQLGGLNSLKGLPLKKKINTLEALSKTTHIILM